MLFWIKQKGKILYILTAVFFIPSEETLPFKISFCIADQIMIKLDCHDDVDDFWSSERESQWYEISETFSIWPQMPQHSEETAAKY